MNTLTVRLLILVCILLTKSPLSGHEPESPIFLDILPKSGTAYILRTLCSFFKLDFYPFAIVRNEHLPPKQFQQVAKNKRFLTFSHVLPNACDHCLIENSYDRMLLHFRDPRQVLASVVHYFDYVHATNPAIFHSLKAAPPDHYFRLSFHEKVDWQIHDYFSWTLLWIEQWLDVIEDDPQIPIKVTTFEDMVADPLSFFRDIVAFYGIDPEKFTKNDLPPKNAALHFRKGLTDEWRDIFTEEQKQLITAMMPERFFEYFGWQK